MRETCHLADIPGHDCAVDPCEPPSVSEMSEAKIQELASGTAQPWDGTLDNSIEIGDLRPLRAREKELLAKIDELKRDLKVAEDKAEALHQKYADCPHKPLDPEVDLCGCSYDRIGDECACHAPAIRRSS